MTGSGQAVGCWAGDAGVTGSSPVQASGPDPSLEKSKGVCSELGVWVPPSLPVNPCSSWDRPDMEPGSRVLMSEPGARAV